MQRGIAYPFLLACRPLRDRYEPKDWHTMERSQPAQTYRFSLRHRATPRRDQALGAPVRLPTAASVAALRGGAALTGLRMNRAGANRRTIRGLRPARADAAGSAIPTGKRRFSRECSGPKADSDLRGFDVVWVVNDNCLPSQADLVCPPAFHAYAAAGTFRTSFTSSFQPGAIRGSSASPDCLHPPHAQKLASASEPRRRPGRSASVSASPPLYLPSRGSGRRHSNERIRLRCRDAVR